MSTTKKILFSVLHRPNRSPSQRFRFEQYLPYLKENGFDYTYSNLLSAADDKIFYSPNHYFQKSGIVAKSIFKRAIESVRLAQYDIIFVQREAFMLGTSFFEWLYSHSKAKLVFDFDDSIWLENVSEANKNLVWLKNPSKTANIIKMADLVFAGNLYLATYANQFNKNVKIIPTTIDTSYHKRLDVEKPQDKICIGWTGSPTTIQHLKFALPILEKIKKQYADKVYFKVIGDASFQYPELGIKGIAWSQETEVKELSYLDIGIMPLPNDEWAKGKCACKGIQYMAMAIPTIMSPVGVNTEVIQDGINGYLADSNEEWLAKLSLLIESEIARKTIGNAGFKTVMDHYSVLSQQNNYLKYLNELIL